MCYNIAAGYGDIDAIAQVISDQKPDIVALQEVDVNWGERSAWEDQARYLAYKLNMHYFFGEIYSYDTSETDTPPRRYGLAWLSREPFVYTVNHRISRLSTQDTEPVLRLLPGFPEVAVEFNGQRIHFFNTHLDYRPDPHARKTQISEMMAIMQPANTPVILMGDLNARPGAPELVPLFESLEDAWPVQEDAGFTFPADAPDRRIDYILHSDHFTVKGIYVADTQASDHRPVIADLVLRKDQNEK
ncbi:MAG: endonuclease/exonuclease/phosphatase family protein [Cyclonatronaceae bacterium]